jgi:acetate kinase
VAEVRSLLAERSGLAGLAGGRTDVRQLTSADDADARLAVRVLVRQVAAAVAGAVTTLDRWDGLVFTGGIGVHSADIREAVCARLLVLRPGADELGGAPSEQLAAAGVRIITLPVDEEAVLDRLVRRAVRDEQASRPEPASGLMVGP